MRSNEIMARVGDEIAEMAGDCLVMRTRLISRAITGIYDAALRPFGLNSAQFALLVVIGWRGPISRSEIGRVHHQERSTLTRNLKIMLSEGWIEESEADVVGRVRPIVLSKSGRNLLQKVAPVWRKCQSETSKILGPEGVKAINSLAGIFMKKNKLC